MCNTVTSPVAASQLNGKFNQLNQAKPDNTTRTMGIAKGSKHKALSHKAGLGNGLKWGRSGKRGMFITVSVDSRTGGVSVPCFRWENLLCEGKVFVELKIIKNSVPRVVNL